MKNVKILCFIAFVGQSLAAQNVPYNREIFDEWVKMRVGTGEPVFWFCFGEVYTYPEGKLVAKMEGTDCARLLRITKDSVVQLNRKIFAYEDPITGEVMENLNDKKVEPIAYPYQYITYVNRGDGKMVSYVEQGKGNRVTKMPPGGGITARMLNGNMVYSAPVFLNFKTPQGNYEAYENYDFFVNKQTEKLQDKYQLYWNRYGDLPPFLGGGKGVIQLVCYRVDKFEDLPEKWKTYLKTKYPLWMKPPQDMKEIAELQK